MKNTITQTETGYIELVENPKFGWKKTEYVNGKAVYTEDAWGEQEWISYDESGNQVYYKNRYPECLQEDFDFQHWFYGEYQYMAKDYGEPKSCRCDECGNFWERIEYDYMGNETYWEDSDGRWEKHQYNQQNNLKYWADSDGDWQTYEYDDNGNCTYTEDLDNYWEKTEYDEHGNELSTTFSDD